MSGRGEQICHAQDDTIPLYVNRNCKAAADRVQVNTQAHHNYLFPLKQQYARPSSGQNSEPQGNPNNFLFHETPMAQFKRLLLLQGRRANFWAHINFYSKHTMTSHSKLISSFPKLNLLGYVLKSCFFLCPEMLWCIINIKSQKAVLLLISGNEIYYVRIHVTCKTLCIWSTAFPKSRVFILWNLSPFTECKSCTDKCFLLSDIKCVCYCTDLGRQIGKLCPYPARQPQQLAML